MNTAAIPAASAVARRFRGIWRTPAHERATPSEATANIRKATWSRVGFAVVMALLATSIFSPLLALGWAGFMTAWELVLRPALEDRFALPAAQKSQRAGFAWLTAIHFVGGAAYTGFAVVAWQLGGTIGMVLATAWICGSANHLSVYFADNRSILLACIGPLALAAASAPFLTEGVSLHAAVSAAALTALVAASILFGLDRQLLMARLSRLDAARLAADQANEAKSRFLATMSHELRTPLNSVIGYAELIEEEGPDGAAAQDARKIRSSARQLLSVIDVILDLSKLESGLIELERERVDVAAVLSNLREAAPALAAINGNVFEIIEHEPLGEAALDLQRVHQCLRQLVSNAAKFTRDGRIEVSARRSPDGRMLIFQVSDNGIGIPADQQQRIFDAFVQLEADEARRYEGSGLGLALVRRLARLMGGDVSCESIPGKGAVFTLSVTAA